MTEEPAKAAVGSAPDGGFFRVGTGRTGGAAPLDWSVRAVRAAARVAKLVRCIMGGRTRVWGVTAAVFFSTSVPSPGFAGPIANVQVVVDYDKYAITYDLKNGQPCPVSLLGSTDGGKTFDLQMEYVRGDVGPSVSPGKGKRILWEALKDFPDGIESIDIILDVVATCPPPSRPAPAAAVAPVRTTAEYLADLRGDIEETTKLMEEKKQELTDLDRNTSDLKEKYSDIGAEVDQIDIKKAVNSDVYDRASGRTYRTLDTRVSSSDVKQYNKRGNEMRKISDQIDSNKSRREVLIKLIREYEKELNELKKEERDVAKGGR